MPADALDLWRGSASAFWQSGVAYALGGMTCLGLLIWFGRPADRVVLVNTVWFFLAAVMGQLLAALLHGAGFEAFGGVLYEASVVAAGLALIRLGGVALFRLAAPLAGLAPPRILEDLVVIAAYVVWGLVRLRVAGLDLSSIVATSAVITAIVAFSMQETLGNILGGLALEFDSAFGVGDWIRVDDASGRVTDIRWRSISIETNDWETVVIPNSHLVRSKLVLLGHRQGAAAQWRRWVRFEVGLETPPERVIEGVEAALRSAQIASIAAQPAPDCVLLGFDSGAARYAARYFITEPAREDAIGSAVRDHVLKSLQRAGIRLAVPERSVHVVAEDATHREEVRARELARRKAALRTVALFGELNETELGTLAEHLAYAPFAAGDVITRQGAVAHWLYILTGGEVDVLLEAPGAGGTVSSRLLTRLSAPSVFGEMGLMTGEPRRSTVVARSAVECYRLDKAAFQSILLPRAALAEHMSRILAGREVELARAKHDLDASAGALDVSHQSAEILKRIKRFFGIG